MVETEAGGITQHIGAYQVDYATGRGQRKTITFLDTPGHEAFCGIRQRGAAAADIAILAVSAEDGVKPQTLEAWNVIKKLGMPFVVAITKIDKPNANIDNTKKSLGENEIYVEGWGGDVPCVPISSVTGTGIPELLDMIILVAELADLTTDPNIPATGIVIESDLDARSGIAATVLIKDGSLFSGSFALSGKAFAPVRYIEDFQGKKIDLATASMPARILGWNAVPQCGLTFSVVSDKKEAEKLIRQYRDTENNSPSKSDLLTHTATINPDPNIPATEIDLDAKNKKIVVFPLIIKADAIGSLEAVIHELTKINDDRVRLKIISASIGEINENDIKQASGDPNTLVLGFNVKPDKKAASIIERNPTKVMSFNIIYDLVSFVRESFQAKIPKEYMEESLGILKVIAVFSKEKDRQIIGGKVESGSMATGNDIRIIRREAKLGSGKIRELQEKKIRVQEVASGHECGAMIEAKIEIAPGDKIECVRTVEVNTKQ